MSGARYIIDLILKSRPELSYEEVINMIKKRVEELGGLIEEDAAAMIVAKELGITIPRKNIVLTSGKFRIADIVPGLRGITIVARILKVPNLRYLSGEKVVLKVLVGDDSGVINLVLWGRIAKEFFNQYKPGDAILIEKGIAKKYRGKIELSINDISQISKLENIEEEYLPSLEELAKKFDVDVVNIHVSRVFKGEENICIYGWSPNLGNVKVVIPIEHWRDYFLQIEDKQIIVQGFKVVQRDKAPHLIFCGSSSRFFPLEFKAERKYVPPRYRDDSDSGEYIVEGIPLAIIPFKRGGRVFIFTNNKLVRMIVFDERSLVTFYDKLFKQIVIWGVILRNNDLRLDRCFSIENVASPSKDRFLKEKRVKTKLKGTVGHVLAKGALISLDLKFNCRLSKPLLSLLLRVDDGTDQILGISNNPEIIERLLGIDRHDICEYPESILAEIIDYSKHQLLGREITIDGYLFRDRTMILLKVD